jgi:hypothetical protein
VVESVGNLHSVELFLNLCNSGDRTVELDQRLGEVIGDLDVLEPVKRRDRELGNGDVPEGVDIIDPVNGSLDSVVDGSDVVLDGRPEIAKSALDEVGDL